MTGLLLMGLLIGMRHALEADHVAALVSLGRSNYSVRYDIRQGVVWGLGHSITLFLFGSGAILIGSAMPQRLAAGLECAVGIMLILLGADLLRRLVVERVHFDLPDPAGAGSRSQAGSQDHRPAEAFPVRALLVGLMHGMAGSAALIVLTLQRVDSPLAAMLYILLFGIGSMFGMALVSAIIAFPLRRLENRPAWLGKGFRLVVGSATTLLGLTVVYQSHVALMIT
ncbi:MAG: urease accessory protein [Gammaproteobacteria bacterium]|nr:urease accessory protein [Gammaproteobacteria bacterium]